MTRPRIAVVGGGITGLSAAFELRSAVQPPDVVVYEDSGRLGGRIETATFAGTAIDTGPDSFITRRPAAVELCEQLGLGDELISPGVSGALVFARGALHPLPPATALGVPTDLRALARSRVLSWPGLARVAGDLALPAARKAPVEADPSVADVLRPRIGAEALALLVDPLIGGINAGTSANLSLRSVAPQLAEAAKAARAAPGHHGSVIRALRAAARSQPGPTGKDARPVFAGLGGGLGRMIDTLEQRLRNDDVKIELGRRVTALRRAGDHLELTSDGGSDLVDGVLLALPAPAGAALLGEIAPAATAVLARIRYASVALVTFFYDTLELPSGGTGILVPRPFRDVVTAVTFTSVKWPSPTVAAGAAIVRASVGSIDDPASAGLADDDLVARVRADLQRVAGISTAPTDVLIKRFPSSFPQYEPGHAARVDSVRRALADHPGLGVAGAAYDGIGIPACIESGRRQAAAVLEAVARSRARGES